MGATPSSLPENIYEAVARNDEEELRKLWLQMAELGLRDPAGRAAALAWRDKEGRTALLLAAAKNYRESALLLIQNGADVRFVNTMGRGNVLHEAAHNGHDKMVELLLQQGAQPFVENASGRTPMELAVAAKNVTIVRRLEREALFFGMVAFKVSKLAGLSHAYEPRWVVVMQTLPNPAGGETRLRKVMWVYSDRKGEDTRFEKVWLGGASTQRKPADGGGKGYIVRLHSRHAEPRTVYSRWDRGFCVCVRPASLEDAAPQGAADACERLVEQCDSPSLPRLPPALSLPLAAAVVPSSLPPPRSGSRPQAGVAGPASAPAPYTAVAVRSAPACPATSLQANCDVGAVLWAQHKLLQWQSLPQPSVVLAPHGGAAQALSPSLPSPTPAAVVVPPTPLSPPQSALSGLAACVGAAGEVDDMQALPGETDPQFAARLGGRATSSAPRSQEQPSLACASRRKGHHSRDDGSASTSRSSIIMSDSSRDSSDGGGTSSATSSTHSSGGSSHSTAHILTRSPPARAFSVPPDRQEAPPPRLQPGGGPSSATSTSSPSSSRSSGSGGSSRSTAHVLLTSSPPARAFPLLPDQLDSSPPPLQPGNAEPPDVPPTGTAVPPAVPPAIPPPPDEVMCIICLCEERKSGFLHGSTVHACACAQCAAEFPVGAPCPLCRAPVERVLGVY